MHRLGGIPLVERNAMVIKRIISRVQGTSRARTVDAFNMIDTVRWMGERIEALGVNVDDWMDGRVCVVDLHARRFPKGYHHVPFSTQFSVYRADGDWMVTDIRRRRTKEVMTSMLSMDTYIERYKGGP